MAIITGLALLVLGLAIGFVIAWAFNVGASMGLTVGLLLLVAGAIVGFISEWLIDEAYRRNRELQRQLREREGPVGTAQPVNKPEDLSGQLREREEALIARGGNPDGQNGGLASETLVNFLRQRDEEIQQIREQLTATDLQMDTLRGEFETYQRTHPDNLAVIKGIGPVYQWKLRDAGFNSYKQLAAADPDQLRRMLDIKKWQRVNVESWIEQARDWVHRAS